MDKIELSKVASPINGTIEVLDEFNVGDYMNSGVKVLRIVPENTNLKMEIMVKNKDIGQVKIGENVKYRFLAFPYKEYGVVKGKIVKISSDISVKSNELMYKIEGEIPEVKLYNRKGKSADINLKI